MDVMVDTNILERDIVFQSPGFEALKNYLSVSNNNLLIPEVVEMELFKHMSLKAHEDYSNFSKLLSYKLLLLDTRPTKEEIRSGLIQQYDFYTKKILKKVAHGEISLEDIVKRSLSEIPPFKSKGRGFRDALIWYSLLHHLSSTKNTKVAFITGNTEDFGKENLFPQLKSELEELGFSDRVEYFNKLPDFLVKHGQNIAFINLEYIENAIELAVDSYGNSVPEEAFDMSPPDSDADWDLVDFNWLTTTIDNYYIFREDEEHYYLNVVVSFHFNFLWVGEKLSFQQNMLDSSDSINREMLSDSSHRSMVKEFELKVNKSTHDSYVLNGM